MKGTALALTGALIVAATTPTLAASNPFADVPAGHWSHDAVAQLAESGVVDGYGDGSYRGAEAISRYEMAAMVARALSKSGLTAADRAMLDKLTAEFGDELARLGVRVSALEKKVDNVRFHGILRYTYQSDRVETQRRVNNNNMRIRLMADMNINAHWTGKARVEYGAEHDNLAIARNSTTVVANRAYVEGVYGKATIDLGKFQVYSFADDGLLFDDDAAGAQVSFGDKARLKVFVGRYDIADYNGQIKSPHGVANMVNVELLSDKNKPLYGGLNFMRFANKAGFRVADVGGFGKAYRDSSVSVIGGGLGCRFGDFNLFAACARNTKGEVASAERTSYLARLAYKGAVAAKPGSYGLFVAYRQAGTFASISPTGNIETFVGRRGVHFGGSYTLARNMVGYAEYFAGKELTGKLADGQRRKASTLVGRVEMYF